jgi:TMEM175 potassium channel family protein
VLLMAAVAYAILTVTIVNEEGKDSLLARAVGRDLKGKLSIVAYAVAIALCFVNHWIAAAIYILVALVWLVPDRRIERVVTPPAS